VTGCTAVAVSADVVHPWVRWFVPQRILIRVSAPIWADPAAQTTILRQVRSRALLCAAAHLEASEPVRRDALGVLECDAPYGPSVQVYAVGAAYPFSICGPGPRAHEWSCRTKPPYDPAAIRIRPTE
jgi:hypothetical protein